MSQLSDLLYKAYSTKIIDDDSLELLNKSLAEFHDPLSPGQLHELVQIATLRQVILARNWSYTDTDIATLVLLGQKDEAMWRVSWRRDLRQQIFGYEALGITLRRTGKLDLATLEEIKRRIYTPAIEDKYYPDHYWCCVEFYASIGHYSEAQALIELAQDELSRNDARCSLAKGMAEYGDFENALEIVESLWQNDRAWMQYEVIRIQVARTQDFEAAISLINRIERETDRAQAFVNLADKIWAIGQTHNARDLLEQAKQLGVPTGILARTYINWGDLTAAASLLSNIPDPNRAFHSSELNIKVQVLAELGYSLESSGVTNPYYQQAHELLNDKEQLGQYLTLYAYQKGNLAKAREFMVMLPSQQLKRTMLSTIANEAALNGRLIEAQQLFEEVRQSLVQVYDTHDHARALLQLAKAYYRVGRTLTGLALLQEVKSNLEHVTDWRKDAISQELLVSFAEFGNIPAAMEIADAAGNAHEEMHRRARLVKVMMPKGQTEQALRQLDRIYSLWDAHKLELYSSELMSIAESFVWDTRLELARDHLYSLLPIIHVRNNEFQDQEVTDVMAWLTRLGDLTGALELADTIVHSYERCRALRLIVQELVAQNDIEQAEAVLRRLENGPEDSEYQLGRTRITLASALHRLGRAHESGQLLEKVLQSIVNFEIPWHKLRVLIHLGLALAQTQGKEAAQRAYAALERAIAEFRPLLDLPDSRYVNLLPEICQKQVTALIEAGELERAREMANKMSPNGWGDIHYFIAFEALARAFGERKQYAVAYQFLKMWDYSDEVLDRYVILMLKWSQTFADSELNDWLQSIETVISILGWVRPDWREIDNMLHSDPAKI